MFRKGYSYDDLLLVPKRSGITDLNDVDISTSIGGITLDLPICSANMDTVTETDMLIAMAENGGIGFHHRFCDFMTQEGAVHSAYRNNAPSVASVGLWDNAVGHAKRYEDYGAEAVCLDIAHGHHDVAIERIRELDAELNIPIIAGNVATADGAYDLANAGANVVKTGIGPGCFAEGTRVLMSNGTYKNIEDVEEGDRLINKDGKPVDVSKSWCTGEREVARLETNKWYNSTYVTPDHKYWTGDLNTSSESTLKSSGYAAELNKMAKTKPKSSKYKWKEIRQYEQDVSLTPTDIEFELNETFEIKLVKWSGGRRIEEHDPDVVNILEPSYETGYIFGTYLGDGSTYEGDNGSKRVSWAFGLEETDIAEKLKSCLNEVMDNINPQVKTKGGNVTEVSLCYNPLARLTREFGKKTEKHLPNKYLVDNKPYLRGLRDGLVDSDGHIEDGGRICFVNTSTKLIELFGILCSELDGGFPNFRENEITTGNLSGADIEEFNTPYSARYNVSTRKRITDAGLQVVKPLDYEETNEKVKVYDLEVDCPTHSFIANNCAVHNSHCSTRIKTGAGVPQLTAINEAVKGAKLFEKNAGRSIDIIADGGIRSSGDIVKALMMGADAVMLGGMLMGTDEAPGHMNEYGKIETRGMASNEARRNAGKEEGTAEGIEGQVEPKGPVKRVLDELRGGIQSGVSYCGSDNLEGARENAEFIEITPATQQMNNYHSVEKR